MLLDEPYTGLDPHAASVLRDVLSALRDGERTVVMVTHNLSEGLKLATRVAIQVRGRFAWEGPRSDLDPESYAAYVADWLANGATVVGGCCGTRPAHIARLRTLLDGK